jgi:hypothetical protein
MISGSCGTRPQNQLKHPNEATDFSRPNREHESAGSCRYASVRKFGQAAPRGIVRPILLCVVRNQSMAVSLLKPFVVFDQFSWVVINGLRNSVSCISHRK